MDRTERFYRIERLMRSRRPGSGLVSFAELMDELGVSRATLKRDLEYLRSRMDAPIVYDRFHNGYRFEAASAGSSAASHELPGVWFSEPELYALLTMHQLVKGLDSDGVLARHLQPLFDKLLGMLGSSDDEARQLMRRVRVVSTGRRAVPSRWFERVGDALVRRRRLHLHYRTRGRAESGERDVSPQRLVHHRNTWYLDAWCHRADALRRFALDAVEDAQVLEQRAKDIAIKAVEAALDQGYGAFVGAKAQSALLVFDAEAARWVSREEWHPQQMGSWREDGSYTLQVPFADPTELVMDILRHGAHVRVAEPAALQAAVAAQLKRAAALYGPAP